MLSNKVQGASKTVEPAYIEDVFSTYTYTGNGSTQTITNGIDLAGKGGLVWFKPRNTANNHNLVDNSRGLNKFLITNSLAAEGTTGAGFGVASFNSNGFSLNPPWTSSTNTTDTTQVAWTFRKQPKFFDVVTYTGNDAGSRFIPHNLGSVPGCILFKRTNSASNWRVFHRNSNSTSLRLNSTGQTFNNAASLWSNTSTEFEVFTGENDPADDTNIAGTTYVAYLFAHNAGGFGPDSDENVISCGSFTTDASGNGTVNLGYEPQWLFAKQTAASSEWLLIDIMRGASQNGVYPLSANSASAENPSTGAPYFMPNATGFSTTGYWGTAEVIYIAIRRGPMKLPTDATKVFKAIARTGTGGAKTLDGVGFPPDFIHSQSRDAYGANSFFSRLVGPNRRIDPSSVSAQSTGTTDIAEFQMDGVLTGGNVPYINDTGIPYINHHFRRAPSFFDQVAYTGNLSEDRYLNHNLKAIPELVITRAVDRGDGWYVYHKAVGNGKTLFLYTTATPDVNLNHWKNPHTASLLALGYYQNSFSPNPYLAYLFATCPGVSKVGSYTGTGTTQAIACGFTNGARFVMIKRTDSTGDWYVWDSARGIVAGNDPYLLMNTITAEVTNTDYIDPSSAGFEISSTAPAAINASGGSFIFLAVA